MIRFFTIGILLLLAQVVLFKNIFLFNAAMSFPYILILFLLPINTSRIVLLLAGMATGLFVDMFYDTPGMHAAAAVAIMFLRPFWLGALLSGSSVDASAKANIGSMGFSLFLIYLLPITFIHHSILLFVEAANLGLFWITLNKVVWSTVFSVFCIVILQYLFSSERKRSI